MKNRYLLVAVALMVAACGGEIAETTTTAPQSVTTEAVESPSDTTPQPSVTTMPAAAEEEVMPAETVTIAVDRTVVHETIFGFMQDYCPEEGFGVAVEVVLGSPRYLDRLVLLQQGDVDLAASGYNTIPVIVEQGLPIATIAGTNLGARDLVVRADLEVNGWDDLAGLIVGAPAGSLATHALEIGLVENGIALNEVEFVTMSPGPQATVALARGDVDAVVGWEPWASQVVIDELGYVPFDYLESSVGPLNGALAVHEDHVGDDKISEFVACMIAAADLLNTDAETHIAAMRGWSGLSQAVAESAHRSFVYDTNVYLANTELYADVMFEEGLLRENVTDRIASAIDYSILETVTGNSASELGQDDQAPGRS